MQCHAAMATRSRYLQRGKCHAVGRINIALYESAVLLLFWGVTLASYILKCVLANQQAH